MNHELVVVLDFGGQYNQLIARRVREQNVYCEMYPCTKPAEEILAKRPKGIIFTGGPSSVYEDGAPKVDKAILEAGIPVLGICYGAQLIAYMMGGEVVGPVIRPSHSDVLHLYENACAFPLDIDKDIYVGAVAVLFLILVVEYPHSRVIGGCIPFGSETSVCPDLHLHHVPDHIELQIIPEIEGKCRKRKHIRIGGELEKGPVVEMEFP